MSERPSIPVTKGLRPVTDDQREAARRYIDDHVEQIRGAFGFVILRRYDKPQPQYGIHEITGVQIPTGIRSHRLPGLKSKVVGLVSALIADEFGARVRYEQPLTSQVAWKHMSPQLRSLIANASILPIEYKGAEALESDFLDNRVRLIAATPVLQFLQA